MPRKWELSVESQSMASSYTLCLGVSDPATGKKVVIVDACGSLEEFEKELACVKLELDGMLAEARELWRRRQGIAGTTQMDPRTIWQEMEHYETDEEMFSYYNSLDNETREKVADFILMQVNMFHGRGPVFAAHYDASTHTLG